MSNGFHRHVTVWVQYSKSPCGMESDAPAVNFNSGVFIYFLRNQHSSNGHRAVHTGQLTMFIGSHTMAKNSWMVTAGPTKDSMRYIGVVEADTDEAARTLAEMWRDDEDPDAPIGPADVIEVSELPTTKNNRINTTS